MRMISTLRYAASAIALGGVAALALANAPQPAQGQASFVQNGEAGFVVANVAYALSEAASETGACPDGMTSNAALAALFGGFGGVGGEANQQQQAQQQQQQAQPDEAQAQAFFARLTQNVDSNPCMNPAAAGPDAGFRTVEAANIPAHGIDLDGQNSTANGRAASGTCAHADFRGFNGERGIDNQFFRAVGCSNSFQPGGSSVDFNIEMLTGAWGILFTLSGVDDIRNDNNVEVGIYANADPIQLSPNREPLPNATYAITQDPRFRATARGRIVNGVLTTEPVDIRWWKITNSIWLERPLDAARLRVTISPEGVLDGYLAGYTPVEAMYDFQYGYRNGTDGEGQPAPLPLRLISAMGAAGTLGHTCNGAYHALYANADGGYDPETGRCTSISTQYRVRAIPAFVVDTQTESVNQDLGPPARDQNY